MEHSGLILLQIKNRFQIPSVKSKSKRKTGKDQDQDLDPMRDKNQGIGMEAFSNLHYLKMALRERKQKTMDKKNN